MCGICGLVHTDPARPVERRRLERMTDALRHRGPDGRGLLVAPGVGLGFRRLAIVDLETGDQPLASEGGALHLVCNGEIYNAPELRRALADRGHRFATRSDAEVILHLYQEHGEGCLAHLRGMFAFALWDARQRSLLLARDRFGIKPLCYALTPEGLFFASEYKAILAYGAVPAALEPTALRDLLTCGAVITPHTMCRGIERLPAAHALVYRAGEIRLQRYWSPDLTPRPRPRRRERDWADQLRDQLRDSVRLHLRSDVEVGAWLSAGIDSSAVARLALEGRPGPLATFTLAFEDAAVDEVRRRRLLCDYPGQARLRRSIATCGSADFASYARVLWHSEDPFRGFLDVARCALAAHSARSVKVVLTGEGADELFFGYPWYRGERLLGPAARLPAWLRLAVARHPQVRRRWPGAASTLEGPRQLARERFHRLIGQRHPGDDGDQLLSTELEATLRATPPATAWPDLPAGFARWPRLSQLQYFDVTVRLADIVVRSLDAGAMAASLEARVPFLDHRLFEWCARMPHALKLRGNVEKHILRQAMAPLLPRDLLRRRKFGMITPAAAWLRGPLPEQLRAQLSVAALRDKGYFDPATVQRLLAQHREGRADHSRQLATVLNVQLWDTLFLRRPQQWSGLTAPQHEGLRAL